MNRQVLIAGGGIAGMAAGFATARSGWQARVFERSAAFSEVGAGVQLGPNVTRILHAWGMLRSAGASNGRVVGTVGSISCLVGLAIANLLQVLGN
jgi:2-polyprenyl-6-methoxyphenol hydroxylase-like FAD-dependent oxidoreductase